MAVPEHIERLWAKMNNLVQTRRGHVITIPNQFPALVLCASSSTLPQEIGMQSVGMKDERTRAVGLTVEWIGTRSHIEAMGHVEVTAGARSTDPALRTTHHAQIAQLNEYEVSLKRVM